MKKRLLAIMDKDGKYLASLKNTNDKVLAFNASATSDFQNASVVDYDKVKDDENNTKMLNDIANFFDGELVLIEMDYNIVSLETGQEREEAKEEDCFEKQIDEAFKRLFK